MKTHSATGNVLFESEESDLTVLTSKVENKLKSTLGYEVRVLLRTIPELEALVKLNPFQREKLDTKSTKACVTFLAEPPRSKTRLPFLHPNKEFKILGTGPREVFSLRYALSKGRFGNPVTFIEKEFGPPTTTRNYNTVVKILRLKGTLSAAQGRALQGAGRGDAVRDVTAQERMRTREERVVKKAARKAAKKQGAAQVPPSFVPVVAAFAANRHVSRERMFSSQNVLTAKGKIFAMLVKGKLVAKLPKARVDELVGRSVGENFDPGHGRLMKQWVVVGPGRAPWVELAREAYEFVKRGK